MATAAGLSTIGMRTGLGDAGAVLTADGYDDPALLALINNRVAQPQPA